jgi:TonB family protein
MSTEPQTSGWGGPSRRRVPRFPLQATLDVTVLRSGIPDTVPGRAVNVCERGIAAMLAEELLPGEAVAIDVQLSPVAAPLQTRAIVRYQDKLRSGLEFVGLSSDQRAAIRNWAKQEMPEIVATTEPVARPEPVAKPGLITSTPATMKKDFDARPGTREVSSGGVWRKPPRKPIDLGWIVLVILALLGCAVFWWRWNRGWEELESGLKTPEKTLAERPQAQVAADVMEKLVVHRVQPAYPAEARKARLQGIIALDIVVGRDGSVVSMHALNGPDVLARAAMDAMRWWKFEPYRVNGEPAPVETTMAVEFKR